MFHSRTLNRFRFLTTYNQAIFLKQEPDSEQDGKFVLWIIQHTTHRKWPGAMPIGKSTGISFSEGMLHVSRCTDPNWGT
jgi:hypothetical protein